MPIFTLAFGSFGDILAAVQLAGSIARALGDSQGASFEYQELILELGALAAVLQHALNTLRLLPSSDARASLLRQDVSTEVAQCHAVMAQFEHRISRYKRSLRIGGSGSMVTDSWRKIGWSLFETRDVRDLREKLAAHKATLNVLLSATQTTALQTFQEEIRRDQAELKISVNQILTVARKLPQALGHPGATVVLSDPVGRLLPLPYEICRSWQNFVDMVELCLRHTPASSSGNFALTLLVKLPHFKLGNTENWAELMRPVSTVHTIMLLIAEYSKVGDGNRKKPGFIIWMFREETEAQTVLDGSCAGTVTCEISPSAQPDVLV